MNILIRTDASNDIGAGHVMRCLTLAEELTEQGAKCQFICREHHGNLIERIRGRGFIVHALSAIEVAVEDSANGSEAGEKVDYGGWLGVSQEQDAQACASILKKEQPDWLIVDHYALDAHWEFALKPHYSKLMVIDDLADRYHVCDLLLDQTYGRNEIDYKNWVPIDCQLLCGSQYVLLRPEFVAMRPCSLRRRADPELQKLLITLGGIDNDNVTVQVLDSLLACSLPASCQVTIVMGAGSPWIADVQSAAYRLPWETRVLVDVDNMAELMASSDLAIGAAGTTSWERCCLGLPTIMLVVAENQQLIARNLREGGAVYLLEHTHRIHKYLPYLLAKILGSTRELLKNMSEAAAIIVKGDGVRLVAKQLVM